MNEELYEHYIEMVVRPDQLEIQFETGQMELPFDQVAMTGLATALTPYRWASYLQDSVVQYCSTMDYTIGQSEREDIAQDIVAERMEACETMQERMNLETALQVWFRSYHYGPR